MPMSATPMAEKPLYPSGIWPQQETRRNVNKFKEPRGSETETGGGQPSMADLSFVPHEVPEEHS